MNRSLSLSSFFSNGMVLQRRKPIRIWGRAKAGANVRVAVGETSATTTAGNDGNWRIELPAMEAGGPHQIQISAGDETLRIDDVLVGELWLCSGQSNMEWPIEQTGPYIPDDGKSYPTMRLFTVAQEEEIEPKKELHKGEWKSATPETILKFSAVAFFFGRELLEKLNVPIGLINSSWGGTPAEAWTPSEDLAAAIPPSPSVPPKFQPEKRKEPHKDPGNIGFEQGWASPDLDDSAWPTMDLPGPWHDRGLQMNGSVWFRREIEIPADWNNQALTLALGAIHDWDVTYFNGQRIGSTGIEQPSWWDFPRKYRVPAELVRPGKNTIAVRVFAQWNGGGMNGPKPLMWIARENQGDATLPLHGQWRYQVEHRLQSICSASFVKESTLWNGMIRPFAGLPIAGVIWYQGEGNAVRAHQYPALLSAMIRAWRREWGQGDLPFLITQLAGYTQVDEVHRSPWAELREAQRLVSEREPNCGLACTIDLGEPNDIHPRNKRDVGHRLALEAMRVAYGDTKTPRSPVYASHTVDANAVTVHFHHPGDGLASDGPVRGCFIAGEDGVWHPANVGIVGHSIIVRSREVKKPVAIRYGWLGYPDCNLKTKAGLPVVPFRTDDAPWTTAG